MTTYCESWSENDGAFGRYSESGKAEISEFTSKKKTAAIQPGRIAAAEDLRQSLGGDCLLESISMTLID